MFSRFTSAARQATRIVAARTFSTASAVAPVVARNRFASIAASAVAASAVAAVAVSQSKKVECAKLPVEGVAGTNFERTFIAVKPDGVQRQLIGKIIQRFEEKGFQLVAMKLIHPTKEMAEGHYDDLKTKPFFKGLTNFFSSGPVVAMVWQGKGSILTGRKMLGETNPATSLPGSIRGDFSIDLGRNIIHGSDGPEGAAHEIKFWFKENEVYDWTPAQNVWIYEKA